MAAINLRRTGRVETRYHRAYWIIGGQPVPYLTINEAEMKRID